MGITIKEEFDWTPGASAVTKDIELSKAPIAALILRMRALGETDASTLAQDLTQFATYMYLVDGGDDITPRLSATEFYQYHCAFFNRIPPLQDGTKANNVMLFLRMIMPLGRPQVLSHNSLLPSIVDPLVGWNPKSTPYLHMEVPADSEIDARNYKIAVVYKDSPFKYSKKWTSWSSQTLSTAGYTDWVIGDRGLMLELFAFHTTEENTNPASDVPSILEVTMERKGKSVLFDGDVTNPLGALLDTNVMADDQYQYLCLSQAPFDNFANCVNLNLGETKLRVKGGVADAAKFAFSVIK